MSDRLQSRDEKPPAPHTHDIAFSVSKRGLLDFNNCFIMFMVLFMHINVSSPYMVAELNSSVILVMASMRGRTKFFFDARVH